MAAPRARQRRLRFAIVAVVCLLLGAATTAGLLGAEVMATGGAANPEAWVLRYGWPFQAIARVGRTPDWEWPIMYGGFVANESLFTTIWLALFAGVLPAHRAARRLFRVSSCMCGSCGYDLTASTARPCPECGA